MKVVISKFFNTLYFKNSHELIKEKDIKKIAEFQKKGNLFGIILYQSRTYIDNILNEFNIKADFYIYPNGRIELKDKIDYFSYESIYRSEMNEILLSINQEYEVMLFSKNDREKISSNLLLDLKYLAYNLAILKFKSDEEAKRCAVNLKRCFGLMLSITRYKKEVFLCSKKSSFDDGIEKLIEQYNINVNDIHIIQDQFIDEDLLKYYSNFYALKQNIVLGNVVQIESISECIELIMESEDEKFSFF